MRSRKLIKGAFLNTLNLLAQILSGFYVMPLMIHAFGDSNFGIWILVGSFMGFAAVLDLGLPSAVSRFVSQAIGRGGKECDQEIKLITATAFYIFIIITFLTLLIIALAIILAPAFLKDHGQISLFRTLLFILCLNNLFVFPTSVFEGILTANLRQDIISSRQIVFTVVRVALTIFLLKNNYGLIAIAWATVGCNIAENFARTVLSYQVDKRVSIAPVNFRKAKVRQLFSYSVYTFVGKIADMLRFQINSLVITIFVDVASVTPFRIASRLIEYFIQFIAQLTGVFSPYFSQEEGRKNYDGIKEKFFLITKVITLIAVFCGGMLLLLGKDFIFWWVGAEYSSSYYILFVLTVAVTFSLSQSAVFPLLYGISKHKFIVYMNMVEGVLNFALSILLVKPFGILGVALGTAIPLFLAKLLIQPVYVAKVLGISLNRYIGVILGPFILAIVSLALPWGFVSPYLKPNLGSMFLAVAVHLVFFLIVVIRFGFNQAERQFFIRIFQRKS